MANLLSTGTSLAGLFGPDAILSAAGVPVTSNPVTVYQSDGSTTATLYTDQTKTTTASNPTATDSFGNLAFYTDPGVYVLSLTVGGVPTTKTVTVQPFYPDAAWNVVVDTGSVSALSGDCRLANAGSASFTETVPTPVLGGRVKVVKTDASTNNVVITTPSGVILGIGLGSGTASVFLSTQGQGVELFSDGTNWIITSGVADPGYARVALFGIGAAIVGSPPAAAVGGFLIQSGIVAISCSSGNFTVNWPAAFPNGLQSVNLDVYNGTGGEYYNFLIGAASDATGLAGQVFESGVAFTGALDISFTAYGF